MPHELPLFGMGEAAQGWLYNSVSRQWELPIFPSKVFAASIVFPASTPPFSNGVRFGPPLTGAIGSARRGTAACVGERHGEPAEVVCRGTSRRGGAAHTARLLYTSAPINKTHASCRHARSRLVQQMHMLRLPRAPRKLNHT